MSPIKGVEIRLPLPILVKLFSIFAKKLVIFEKASFPLVSHDIGHQTRLFFMYSLASSLNCERVISLVPLRENH